MRQAQIIILMILAINFTSCKPKSESGKEVEKNVQQKDTITQKQSDKKENSTKTLNGIEINSNEIQVNNAFLALESGDPISSDNTVPLGEKVVLTINSNGWKNIDGKSFVGITQVITTNSGEKVLESGDMFSKYEETGIDTEYINILKLKAYITQTKPGIEYFIVNFRIWDKKGNGEITGNYKFYVK